MSDDRESNDEAPSDATPTAKVPSGRSVVKRLRRDLKPKFDAALLRLSATGTFTHEQAQAEVEAVLAGINLNEYRREFAARIEAAESHTRHANFGRALGFWKQGQFDLFTRELTDRVWLTTDEGTQVSLTNAKWTHLVHKQLEQDENVDQATVARDTSKGMCDSVRPYMERDPECSFGHAMVKLGHWQQEQAAA
jgi:hypothetical protein